MDSAGESKTKPDGRDIQRCTAPESPRYSLAGLLAQYDPQRHRDDEIDFGPDVGLERAE